MRGLNSIGDEILRVGPVEFGPYHTRFMKPFHDVKIIPVLGMGRGRVEEMGERAVRVITQMEPFRSSEKIHLAGHSLGGLVARYLVHSPEIRKKVISVVSISSPHRGTPAAEPSPIENRWSQWVMRLVKAEPESSAAYYVSARIREALEFSKNYPDLPDIHYASVVGRRNFRSLPLGFQLLERRNNPKGEPSDGLIPVESQKWGHVLGEVSLDHLEQIGLCSHAAPWERVRFSLEFRRQCRLLRSYWRSFHTPT